MHVCGVDIVSVSRSLPRIYHAHPIVSCEIWCILVESLAREDRTDLAVLFQPRREIRLGNGHASLFRLEQEVGEHNESTVSASVRV